MYVVLKIKGSNMYFCELGRYPKFTERLKNAIIYETDFESIDELLEELNSPTEFNSLATDYLYLIQEGIKIIVEEVNIDELQNIS